MILIIHCHLYCFILVKRNNLKNSFCNFLHDLVLSLFLPHKISSSSIVLVLLPRGISSWLVGCFPVARLWPRNAYTRSLWALHILPDGWNTWRIVSPQKRPQCEQAHCSVGSTCSNKQIWLQATWEVKCEAQTSKALSSMKLAHLPQRSADKNNRKEMLALRHYNNLALTFLFLWEM